MRALLVLLLVLGLAACQTDEASNLPDIATPSGKPEGIIKNANAGDVKATLLNFMLSKGYTVTSDTGSTLQVDKPADSLAASLVYGSQMNSTPNARIVFTFVQVGSDTRVVADMMIVTNPGTAFEQRTELNQTSDAKELNQILQVNLPRAMAQPS